VVLKSRLIGRMVRVLALGCLVMGLANASRLLGVGEGARSPLELLGAIGFIYLTAFTLAQLFAAVGLWIQSSWGAVLLVGATASELVLAALGNPHVTLSIPGFVLRLFLLLGGLAVIAYVQWRAFEAIHD